MKALFRLNATELKVLAFVIVAALIGMLLQAVDSGSDTNSVTNQPSAADSVSNEIAAADSVFKYNLSTVDDAGLQKIPGIGPKRAAQILALRQQGEIVSVDDLIKVKGIGPKTLERIRPYFVADSTATTGHDISPAQVDSTKTLHKKSDKKSRVAQNPHPVNINTAGVDELCTIPGIGPVKAQAIINERKTGGSFTKPDDLLRVKGIGPKTLVKMEPYLRF